MTNPVEAVETAIILAIQEQLGHDIVHFDDGQWWVNGCHGPLLLELKPVRVDALQALQDNVSDPRQAAAKHILENTPYVDEMSQAELLVDTVLEVFFDTAMKEETDGPA